MNVSDLLQDSPSQHRKRPSASQRDLSPPSQSAPTTLPPPPPPPPAPAASPAHQHNQQHSHPPSSSSSSSSQPSYPHPPIPPFYTHAPLVRPEPAPVHRITPRPPPPSSSIDATPAMASLQHPSPPHVHAHSPWGPPLAPRQGSSPLNMAAGPHARPSLHQQPPQQIKSLMPGPDRSPIAQRPNTSGASTPSNISAHSPPAKQLPPGTLLTSSGALLLDKRTADEQQKARLATQANAPTPKQRDRDLHDQRERERERQQDMDFIRQMARERGGLTIAPPPDRDRDRILASPHDRPLLPSHDRERDRNPPQQHLHRMSPLARAPPTQPLQQSPRAPGQGQRQHSPTAPGPRITIPPPPHDRIVLPPHERDRDRIPLLPHERDRLPGQIHDRDRERDRLQPPPHMHTHTHTHAHPHRPPPPPAPTLLPGQSQFQTHPPDWERPLEREMLGPNSRDRDRERDKERDVDRDMTMTTRDAAVDQYAFHQRQQQQRMMRERERETMGHSTREGLTIAPRDRGIPRDMSDRELIEREREREMAAMREREREFHIQRESGLTLREMGPSIPPPRDRERVHDQRDRERRTHSRIPSPLPLGPPSLTSSSAPGPTGIPPSSAHIPPHPHDHLARERERELAWEREREREREMERRQYRERERLVLTDRDRDRAIHERERDRAIYEQRERERERVHRDLESGDKLPLPPPHSLPHPLDRDRDRIAIMERDRALMERGEQQQQQHHHPQQRVIGPHEHQQRDRDRDRVLFERERERAVLVEREYHRLPPMDRDRERIGVVDAHRVDILDRERERERDRERERIEMMEREREKMERDMGVVVGASSSTRGMDKMVVDTPLPDRERKDRLIGPGQDRDSSLLDRERQRERERFEHGEQRERERVDVAAVAVAAAERDRTDILVDAADRERERERERIEILERGRERLDMLERERFELLERDRLGGLDIVERERLEMIERERFEIVERERLEMLERERLEMLERLPNAADLARARKEREDRPFVSLGTYVWPRTPFPYYFPEWIPPPPAPNVARDESNTVIEAGSSTLATQPSPCSPPTTELRLTILIPPSFLPSSRPARFRLWGGGLPPPPPFLPPSTIASSLARRRVYTDDSDVIECAVHAGLLTWSAVSRAKKEGRTVKVILALVPTLASASGAVRGVANGSGKVSGPSGGHVNGTTSLPRTRTNTPLPPPPPPPPPPATAAAPSTSSATISASSTDPPPPPIYAGGIWASRFIGGWGESFYGDPSAGRGDLTGRLSNFEEAEDDGRGCVSCGWGWGHDGSAYEVIRVEVVEKNAHVAPGLGIRNRAQRLAEYAQRRVDVLQLPSSLSLSQSVSSSSSASVSLPFTNVTNAPTPPYNTLKRRRHRLDVDVDITEVNKGGSSEAALIAQEAKRMQVRTVCFGGVRDGSKGRLGVGYKYDPHVLRHALFPHVGDDGNEDEDDASMTYTSISTVMGPPPRKRHKVATQEGHEGTLGTVDLDQGCGIVFESTRDTYLVSRVEHGGDQDKEAEKGKEGDKDKEGDKEGGGTRYTYTYTLAVFGPPVERLEEGEEEACCLVLDEDAEGGKRGEAVVGGSDAITSTSAPQTLPTRSVDASEDKMNAPSNEPSSSSLSTADRVHPSKSNEGPLQTTTEDKDSGTPKAVPLASPSPETRTTTRVLHPRLEQRSRWKPSVRVIRRGLSSADFTFDECGVVIRGGEVVPRGEGSSRGEGAGDIGAMVVDGDTGDTQGELRIKVLRWRWDVES